MESKAIVDKIQAAWDKGSQVMDHTPFLLINGNLWPNSVPVSESNITILIDLLLLEKHKFTTCPPMTIDQTKTYIAHLQTEKGEIAIELFADKTPLTVNNFVFLAQQGWYDGVTFHRVLDGFVAQGGDPSGTGIGDPGYAFKNEIVPGLTFDRAGLVAMANAGADTNGSQFFITYAPLPNLDGSYTIFGQVIKGMDVANSLTRRDPSQNADLPPGDKILKVTIEVK